MVTKDGHKCDDCEIVKDLPLSILHLCKGCKYNNSKKQSVEDILLLILEKLEEIKCGIIDVEDAIETKR